ncbi:hypothetical protein, partial [Bradyrhizobium sp. NAS96.2]|uniref:hypothetical protein n=1 Tax=Bradyrhizobium sp. NAS96.2 TaxID=1680160 RepID=UPI001AECB67B
MGFTVQNPCGSLDLTISTGAGSIIIAPTGNFPGQAAVHLRTAAFSLGARILRETSVLLIIDAIAVGAVVLKRDGIKS